jgi:outer membrane protein assembly factor BamB
MCALLILVSCAPVADQAASLSESDEWSMFRVGPAHTGVHRTAGIEASPTVRWTFATDGPVISSPAVTQTVVYFGSDDGAMYAVSREDGREAWRFETGGPVRSSPAVADGKVFFGSYDGSFYALDASSGEVVWSFATDGERRWRARNLDGMTPLDTVHDDPWDFFLSSPVVSNGTVFFGTGEGTLYGLDVATGAVRWAVETDDTIHSSPAVVDGVVYVGNMESRLYAVAEATGEELWHFQAGTDSAYFNQHGLQSSPLVANGRVYVGGRDGGLHTIDASTGEALWKLDTNGSWVLGSAALDGNRLYLGTSDTNVLQAVDATTGESLFSTSLGTYVYSSPAVVGETIYVGTCAGVMFAIDADTGDVRWQFRTEASRRDSRGILGPDGGWNLAALFAGEYTADAASAAVSKFLDLGAFISSPVVRDGVLFVGSGDGNLYALESG